MKMTDRSAQALKLQAGKSTAALIEGHLMLQLKNNRKTWRFRYTHSVTKKRIFLNLGSYPATSVATARKEAAVLDGLLEQDKDPKTERAQQEVSNLTVDWLIKEFIEKDLKKNRKVLWQPKALLDGHVSPSIGSVLLAELNTQNITKMCDAIVAKGHNVTANKVLSITKQMLSFGTNRGSLKINVASELKQRQAGGQEKSRKRNLSFEEIKQLWHYFDAPEQFRISEPVKIMLKLLILTGQRTGDWLNADWNEFDFEQSLWSIPEERYKTGEVHQVPITPAVLELLSELADKFPSKGRLFTHEAKAASRTIRRSYQPLSDGTIRLVIEHFTVHDLRRTCASRMSDLKVDAVVIEKILGHSLPKILAAYNKGVMLDERREALELYQETILNLINNDNVVQIGKAL